MSTFEVKEVLVLDYQPTEEAGKGIDWCQRCKWAPDDYRESSLKNNLWAAACVADVSQVDGLTGDEIIWQILGGSASEGPRWVDGTSGMAGCGCLDALTKVRLPEALFVEEDDQ